ncbi:MAG: beta-ketoacyl-[acyl-carrier-protein] synthase family protein [Planctomycetota bacterium]|jgi:3-oxoacyl-[acyl-carrier-protein] synthase II
MGQSSSNHDIVITGMGVVSPIGACEADFWESLKTGTCGSGPVDCLDTEGLTRTMACQVRAPLEDGYFQAAGSNAGRASRLAVVAARQAVDNAGLAPSQLSEARVSIFAGTTMGETQFIEDRLDVDDSDWLTSDHRREISANLPGTISEHLGAALHNEHWQQPQRAYDLYGACAAGNLALSSARRSLLDDECDIAIAGGADGFSRLAFIGFMRLRVMAESLCRPFDRDRDGLFVGEGAAFFVLERAADAQARGASQRARIIGGAITCEDYHPTRPQPEGDGLTRATKIALGDAGLAPTEIDYVCAHGTGTPQNDMIEIKVMENCFPQGVAFSSVKALTGHTMGAAAAVEAACCVLSLENGIAIPTWNLENVQEPCDLDPVMGGPREKEIRCAVNNSAGFGGYNSSIVLART